MYQTFQLVKPFAKIPARSLITAGAYFVRNINICGQSPQESPSGKAKNSEDYLAVAITLASFRRIAFYVLAYIDPGRERLYPERRLIMR
jgi:hypothetical protein